MSPKNVYELIQERLEVIFKEFDNIYISFSGGKDSGVLLNLCLDYMRRNRLKRRIGVFHMDYEIQYSMTIDYVDRVLGGKQGHAGRVPCLRAFPCNDLYLHVPELLASLGRSKKGSMGQRNAGGRNDCRRFPFL